MVAILFALMICRVSLISGVWTVITSDTLKSSSTDMDVYTHLGSLILADEWVVTDDVHTKCGRSL